MELTIIQHIHKLLRSAHYEYDPSVRQWVGWVARYSGIYAQEKTVEDVRAALISILEEFLIMDLQEGKKIPGISISSGIMKSRQNIKKYATTPKS